MPENGIEPPLARGDLVVVRTTNGPARATVVAAIPDRETRLAFRDDATPCLLRRLTPEDISSARRIGQLERAALQFCLLKIQERGLAMKLTRVEQLADGSRLIFSFTAEERVDFRELVRDLAAEFRTRIEMRQIGVRDEARLLGGYGSCGRPLCCTTWLNSFEPVSIKMAKQLKLSLNPTKLSGLCGRLKCCLRYELPEGKVQAHAGSAHDTACGGCGCGQPCGGGGSCGGSCGD
jgi:cell fate regulator YaaT (PSP1 superfamily)